MRFFPTIRYIALECTASSLFLAKRALESLNAFYMPLVVCISAVLGVIRLSGTLLLNEPNLSSRFLARIFLPNQLIG